jgi:hypothetical protein
MGPVRFGQLTRFIPSTSKKALTANLKELVQGSSSAVQIAMIAGLPYTALRDAVLTHPTLVEGLIPLFSSAPSTHNVVENGGVQISAT